MDWDGFKEFFLIYILGLAIMFGEAFFLGTPVDRGRMFDMYAIAALWKVCQLGGKDD